MSVHNNCYLFRSGKKIVVDTNGNPDDAKRFDGNNLGYSHNGKGELEFVKDDAGNYYYLADDCKQIQ